MLYTYSIFTHFSEVDTTSTNDVILQTFHLYPTSVVDHSHLVLFGLKYTFVVINHGSLMSDLNNIQYLKTFPC